MATYVQKTMKGFYGGLELIKIHAVNQKKRVFLLFLHGLCYPTYNHTKWILMPCKGQTRKLHMARHKKLLPNKKQEIPFS